MGAWVGLSGTENAGVVTFHFIQPYVTKVMLQLDYAPHGLIESVGDKLGFVSRKAQGDLERFKTFIETRGEATGEWRGTIDQKKELVFELWDECDDKGDAKKGGTKARAALLRWVNVHLPKDGADAFTKDELERFNARRRSRARFAPYE